MPQTGGTIATPRRRQFVGLANCIAGLCAFVVSCQALHCVAGLPRIAQVTPKLEYFAGHKDEFDTLFVGSSRIYHQVMPEVFDEVLRANGREARSFNFGIDG